MMYNKNNVKQEKNIYIDTDNTLTYCNIENKNHDNYNHSSTYSSSTGSTSSWDDPPRLTKKIL